MGKNKHRLTDEERNAHDVAYLVAMAIVGKETALAVKQEALDRFRGEPGCDIATASKASVMVVAGLGVLEGVRLLEEAMPGAGLSRKILEIARDIYRARGRKEEALSCQILIELQASQDAPKVVLTDAAGFAKAPDLSGLEPVAQELVTDLLEVAGEGDPP